MVVTEDLKRLCGPGPVNTDSQPLLEFAAPKSMFFDDPQIAKRIRQRRFLSPRTTQIMTKIANDVDLQIKFAEVLLSANNLLPAMIDYGRATPQQKERFAALVEAYCAKNEIDYSKLPDEQLKHRCRLVQINAIEENVEAVPDKASSYFYIADLYYNEAMYDKSIAYYSKHLKIAPNTAEAHYNLAQALIATGRLDEAVGHLNEALRLRPDDPKMHSTLAYALAGLDRLDEAIEHFTEALRLDPASATTRTNLGLALHRQGRFDEAVRQYAEALRLNPDSAKIHQNLASTFVAQDKLDPAAENFRKALRLNPDSAEAHHGLGQVLARQGSLDEAITHFQASLQINPDNGAVQKSLRLATRLRDRNRQKQ
jgi:tetratricopeptide (TPR) repeat protein